MRKYFVGRQADGRPFGTKNDPLKLNFDELIVRAPFGWAANKVRPALGRTLDFMSIMYCPQEMLLQPDPRIWFFVGNPAWCVQSDQFKMALEMFKPYYGSKFIFEAVDIYAGPIVDRVEKFLSLGCQVGLEGIPLLTTSYPKDQMCLLIDAQKMERWITQGPREHNYYNIMEEDFQSCHLNKKTMIEPKILEKFPRLKRIYGTIESLTKFFEDNNVEVYPYVSIANTVS